jgi:hypothetical protein
MNISEAFVVTTLELACVSLTAGLIYLLSTIVWSSWAALVPPVIWMTYPLSLWLTRGRHVEIPFLLVFFAAIWVFLRVLFLVESRASQALVAGSLAGIAMLIRPIAIGLGVVEVSLLLLMRRGRSLRRALTLSLILLVGNVAAVLPWELWLYTATGRVVLLSTGGRPAVRDGLTFAAGGYAPHSRSVPDDVHDLMERIVQAYDRQSSFATLAEMLREEASQRPLTVFKLIELKVVRSWFATDTRRFEGAIGFVQVVYLLLAVASTVVGWRLGSRVRSVALVVWVVTLYFWVMTFLAMSIVRYMVPAIGLLFLLFPALLPSPRVQRA